MSRKTTARRGAISVLAATTLLPGFALGIAQAAATDPAVTGLTTSSVAQGQTATFAIAGKNFADTTRVYLDPDRATSTSEIDVEFIVVSPTKIVVKVDGTDIASPAKYDVVVNDGADSANAGTKDDLYVSAQPTISSAEGLQDSGPASAGVKLTVTGSGFLGTSSVVFRNGEIDYPVKGFKVLSDTKMEVQTGELPAGKSVIRISNGAGTSTASYPADGDFASVTDYVYNAYPVLAKVAPALVDEDGGQVVTVNGSGLGDASVVKLVSRPGTADEGSYTVPVNLQQTDFIATSHVELVFKMPAASEFLKADGTTKAPVTAGDKLEIRVTSAGNVSNVEGAKVATIQYIPLPKGELTEPGARFGRVPGVNTITGVNLQGAKVTVGSTQATVLSVTSDGTKLTFRTPINPKSGATSVGRYVTVTTKNGSSVVENQLWWNGAAPVITSAYLDPSNRGVLVVEGRNLAGVHTGDMVEINGVELPAATKIEHEQDSELRVTLPAGTSVHTVGLDNLVSEATSGDDTAEAAVDRVVTEAVYKDADKTVTLKGENLRGLKASEIVWDGDGSWETVVGAWTFVPTAGNVPAHETLVLQLKGVRGDVNAFTAPSCINQVDDPDTAEVEPTLVATTVDVDGGGGSRNIAEVRLTGCPTS